MEKCKLCADELKNSDGDTEETEAFIGAYNCLKNFNPFNNELNNTVLEKCQSVIACCERKSPTNARTAVLRKAVGVIRDKIAEADNNYGGDSAEYQLKRSDFS